MLSNRIYYALKPFIPSGMRIGIRRVRSQRLRRKNGGVWPILERAGTPPLGWPGWPGGKKFAFVLTHDVEGKRGLARVSRLAEMEKKLGLRSSFNFIPEGDYETPPELRLDLQSKGFEVGVHDLRHDGKLFRFRSEFARHARKINKYLSEWGAVGFRGGFMLRNLSWLGELNIEYDASTFDTDPFEPMPNGAETIFPYWIPRAKGPQGYIELPYTLAQDSTLFTLLRESTTEIWKRKLDWIAARGGMALLNVHPDYVDFDGNPARTEFRAHLYREFLEYVKTRYAGDYWHATPREVCRFAKEFSPQKEPRRPQRICMLAYSFYETDNRIRRYTEALARRGDQVDVVALRHEKKMGPPKKVGNITIFGIQRRVHDEKGKHSYLERLVRFCLSSGVFLARAHWKNRYDLIHVHNVPDFLVFGALVPKLMGAKVILDIHDIVPEFYASKFKADEDSMIIRMLKLTERVSANFANHLIISNHLWYDKLTKRSIRPEQCSAFVNHVDQGIFYRRPRTRKDGRFIILFPGGMQWHQGLDLAIRAVGLIRDKAPEAELHIYGDGNHKPELEELSKELGLEQRVRFFDPRSLTEIAEIMANSDLGVVPKRANSFGNEAYSTKIMEFMSQGVPVVVSKTKIDSFYFNDQVVRFFESGNVEDLADAILTMIRNQGLRDALVENAFRYVEKNSWNNKQAEYFGLVDSLTA
jgi:glycosyltransferase involved in cell wall biosynthesis